MKIETVYCYDFDRQSVCAVVSDGHGTYWCEVCTIQELWEQSHNECTMDQFREDLRGQALSLIEDGEYRATSNA